jgi:hypothetical protein
MASNPPNINRANPKGWYQPIILNGSGTPLALEAWQSGMRFLGVSLDDSFALPDIGADLGGLGSIFHVSANAGITGVTVDVTDVGVVGTKIYYNGVDKGTSVSIPPGASLSILAIEDVRWEIVAQVGVYAEPGTVVEASIGEVWVDSTNGNDGTGDGSPSSPYQTFQHAYGIAEAMTPGGQVKSATNRVVIRFRKGTYSIDASINLGTDFIDYVGEGRCIRNQYSFTATPIEYPDVVISADGNLLSVSCNDAVFRSITFEQTAALEEEKTCLRLAEQEMQNVFFKDVGFRAGALNAGTVRAVVQDRTAGDVWNYAKFEDCHTTLTGFLFNGYWHGNAIRCSADDYSFCGFDTTSTYSDPTGGKIECNGYMEDCWGADYCFGSLAGDLDGGYAESGGTKMRCIALSYSFGATHYTGSNGITMTANCSGTHVECQATSNSFAYSNAGEAECEATVVDCASKGYSFGCSALVVTQVPAVGLFSGSAYRVTAVGSYCFGSNSAGTTGGDVDAVAILEDCQAGAYSFGAQGPSVNGTFRRCKGSTGSFGQATAAQTALLMDGCEITDIAAGEEPIFDGVATLIGCKIKVTAQVVEASVGIHDSGPRLYDCDFYGDTSNPNIAYVGGGQLATISVAHCRMNTGLGASLANNIDTPYNVVDADYVC